MHCVLKAARMRFVWLRIVRDPSLGSFDRQSFGMIIGVADDAKLKLVKAPGKLNIPYVSQQREIYPESVDCGLARVHSMIKRLPYTLSISTMLKSVYTVFLVF